MLHVLPEMFIVKYISDFGSPVLDFCKFLIQFCLNLAGELKQRHWVRLNKGVFLILLFESDILHNICNFLGKEVLVVRANVCQESGHLRGVGFVQEFFVCNVPVS